MQIICTYKYYSYLDIQGSYVVGSMMAYPLSEYMIRGYHGYPDIQGLYVVGGVMAYIPLVRVSMDTNVTLTSTDRMR